MPCLQQKPGPQQHTLVNTTVQEACEDDSSGVGAAELQEDSGVVGEVQTVLRRNKTDRQRQRQRQDRKRKAAALSEAGELGNSADGVPSGGTAAHGPGRQRQRGARQRVGQAVDGSWAAGAAASNSGGLGQPDGTGHVPGVRHTTVRMAPADRPRDRLVLAAKKSCSGLMYLLLSDLPISATDFASREQVM